MAQKQKHLMDLTSLRDGTLQQRVVEAQSRPPAPPRGMSISTVQKWVMSSLALTTVLHFVLGLIVAAAFLETDRAGAREGLVVIAGVMGVLGVAAALKIHEHRVASPWLVAGLLPAVAGAFWVL